MEERWLNMEEICKHLSVTNDTVYKWIKEKGMPASRVGRRWMFKREEVDEWIRSGNAAEKRDTEE